MAHLERRRIIERAGGLHHRIDDGLPAVSGIHTPQPRRAVENLAPVVGAVVHILGAHQQPGRALYALLAVKGIQSASSEGVAAVREAAVIGMS